MNLLQIVRKARLGVDAIRTGDVSSALWSDEEVVDAVNTAMDEAAKVIRLADSRILSKTLSSSVGTSFGSGSYAAGTFTTQDLVSEVYTMFALAPDITDYTLPPDFVRVVSIMPEDDTFESVRFRPLSAQDRHFVDQRSIPTSDLVSAQEGDEIFWYTLVGTRGIRFAPAPKDVMNIELVYDFRAPRLRYSTAGTVSITNATTSLTGVNTDWFTSGIRTPAELISGASAVSAVRIDRYYPLVLSIASDTAATMARTWQASTLTTSAYGLAMVPILPDEHHAWLAEMAAAIMLRKVNVETSDKMKTDLKRQMVELVQPEITIRQIQESIPVPPFELPA